MRLLKTHSHTSERPVYKARENAKKSICRKRRHYNKANHSSKTCPVPPVWRGGRDEKDDMAKQTIVKTLPRTVSVAGGGEMKKREVKENTGANTRETKVMTLPQATIVAGGRDKRRKTTRNGKVAQPTVPRGGRSA